MSLDQQWNPTPGVQPGGRDPENISVAVIYPGNRVEKVAVPLKASRIDVAIDPDDPYAYDVVLVDNADRDLGKEVLKKPFHDATLVYRMRGDVFRELDIWNMNPVKQWAAENVVLGNVDATIAVSDGIAARFAAKTGVPTGVAGLAKDPTAWPTSVHTDDELRIATLTNMNYELKIAPIVEWAPVVEDVLAEVGGTWHVCGEGRHAEALADALAGFSHIEVPGFVDPVEELDWANVVAHPSRLDAVPNAILEGLASELPVLSTDFFEFRNFGDPLIRVGNSERLAEELRALVEPERRAKVGRAGLERIRRDHTATAVGREYENFFSQVLSV